METHNTFISSLVGGGLAGFSVDVALFPLDTLKTRLQAAQGFRRAGGFKGIYKGLGPQAAGSAPIAALFFCTYEMFKHYVAPVAPPQALPLVYMTGASIAEVIACLIRVPVEIAKQRRQTSLGVQRNASLTILLNAYKTEGIRKGLYRGFGSTVMREIPFAVVQFLLLEYTKQFYAATFKDGAAPAPWDVALCGSVAGGFAAAVTTPLDVVKTRIMLADVRVIDRGQLTVLNMFRTVYKERGIRGLFAGFVPRVMFITLGGAIFFGMYDLGRSTCSYYLENRYNDDLPVA